MNGTKIKHIELPVTTHSNGRNGEKVTAIVVHHMAGCLTLQQCEKVFQNRKSSATYAIDIDGNVAQYVDENDRPWTTSGSNPDNHAITIELANTIEGVSNKTWTISDKTMQACIELCADICKRYNIPKLYYSGKTGTLLRHCDYSATACPGSYFISKTPYFVNEVNKILQGDNTYYRVQMGAFKNKENAENYAKELNKKGIEAIVKKG